MRIHRPSLACAMLLTSLLGCAKEAHEQAPPPSNTRELGSDLVARVGNTPLSRSWLRTVARRQHLDARAALEQLVDEALLAESARQWNAAEDLSLHHQVEAAQARALLAKLRARVDAPPTEAELAEILRTRWPDLDRPETRVVVHALVPKDVENAEALAADLQRQLAAIPTTLTKQEQARRFQEIAGAFPLPGNKKVTVEVLAPCTADGRIASTEQQGTFAPEFAQATFALPELFATSGPVRTPFGVHVLRLLELQPPYRMPQEELVRAVAPDLLRMRAQPLYEALLAKLRGGHTLSLVPGGEALLGLREREGPR